MNITDIREVKTNPNIPELAPGDTVRVRQKVVEGEKPVSRSSRW
jgi:ribosomal protein L19